MTAYSLGDAEAVHVVCMSYSRLTDWYGVFGARSAVIRSFCVKPDVSKGPLAERDWFRLPRQHLRARRQRNEGLDVHKVSQQRAASLVSPQEMENAYNVAQMRPRANELE